MTVTGIGSSRTNSGELHTGRQGPRVADGREGRQGQRGQDDDRNEQHRHGRARLGAT
ncbi:MAG: hypothetical protein GY873_13280 [Bosea sp.]|nr:hypothetical protein [Bosea sp. (in: a-proteobacteria)]MCP4735155.1 hypothetical protein [Bosea sp. (in: a-proteobacteria)]